MSRRYLPLVAGLLWGTAFPAIQVALDGFSPLLIVLVRAVLATVVIGAVVALRRPDALRISADEVLPLAVLSLFGIGLFYLLQVFAVRFSTPINAAFLTMTYPVFVSVLAPLTLGERFRRADLVGFGLAAFGAYVIVGNGRLIPLFSSPTFGGDILALGASVCMLSYLLLNRLFTRRYDLDSRSITFYMLLFGIPLLAVPVGYTGSYTIGTPGIPAVLALVWLGIGVTAGGFFALNLGLESESTALAALRLLVVPLVSTVLSVVMFAEPLTLPKIVGGVAILLGLASPAIIARLR